MSSVDLVKRELVWIKWKDAVGTWSRFDGESLASLALVINTNVGWIAHENEDRVVLVAGISTSGEVDALVIPTHDIVERIPATRNTKKRKR
tara:strand:- start:708 stop:980 length:273 start_codon:yes stop_codon:yes gene_type:complete